jgi:ATP-dependent Lon protease
MRLQKVPFGSSSTSIGITLSASSKARNACKASSSLMFASFARSDRAFAYLMGQKVKMGVSQQVDTTDFHVEAIDLLSNHVLCDAGIALIVAIYSALKRLSVQAGLVILGDLSIQGNIKPMRSLAEPLQVAMDNGARKALIPLENKRNFLEVSGEIVERVDPIFFSDPMTAAMKALGMT